MHLGDMSVGVPPTNAIVGANIPIATGAALGFKLRGLDRVAVSFFGDGAANIGPFHEGINLAAVKDAPVVFVCENNLYAASTHSSLAMKHRRHRRARQRPTAFPASSSTAWTSSRFMRPRRRRSCPCACRQGSDLARDARPIATPATRAAIPAEYRSKEEVESLAATRPDRRAAANCCSRSTVQAENELARDRGNRARPRSRTAVRFAQSRAPSRRPHRRSSTCIAEEVPA